MNSSSFQPQLLQQFGNNGNIQNTRLGGIRSLNDNGEEEGGYKLSESILGNPLIAATALGLGGGAVYSQQQQYEEIRTLKNKLMHKINDRNMKQNRYQRQMNTLTEKVDNLENTLADLGDSLGSMLHELEVWAEGHVTMSPR